MKYLCRADRVLPGHRIRNEQNLKRFRFRFYLLELDHQFVVDVKTAVEAMRKGATDYILKPFDREALVETVGRILERQSLRDEHARLVEENLEYMGVVSLFERATGLFSTLAVEPLTERLLEGLCLETRARTGVLWLAEGIGSESLTLVGVRGPVRLDGSVFFGLTAIDPTIGLSAGLTYVFQAFNVP